MKKCAICREEKEDVGKNGRCITCHKAYQKEYGAKLYEEKKVEILTNKKKYYEQNKEEKLEKQKEYYQDNKEERQIYNKRYYQENKTEILQQTKDYAENHVDQIRIYHNQYNKEKRLNNPNFKIRTTVSANIGYYIKLNDSSKNGKSCLEYLSYSIQELVDHLTLLFSHSKNLTDDGQAWMTWNNYGRYHANTWNDNDPTTWTWQIDHIIPQSNFNYTSMEDQSFKDSWALSNLRPFSAKQNFLDGARKIRHEK
jgi:hypothetical protein